MTPRHPFRQLVKQAGLPTTEAEFTAAWKQEVANSGYTNTGDYSPLWRLLTSLITRPALALINLLIEQVLPQSFVKTASGNALDRFAWGVGLARKTEAHAQGVIRFQRAEGSGNGAAVIIPLGTEIRSAAINGQVYVVRTTAVGELAQGAQYRDIPVTAVAPGSAYNLASGHYALLTQPLPGGVTVSNPRHWLHRPGADRESDDALRLRIRNQFSAVNQYHTDAVYRAIIARAPGVNADDIYFQHGAPRGPGTANAYLLLATGNPSAEFLADLQASISASGNHGHGDDVQVFAMPETFHHVRAQVYAVDGLTEADRQALKLAVAQRIRAAFRENRDFALTQVTPNHRFSFSRLGQELHQDLPHLHSVEFNLGGIDHGLDIARLQQLSVELA